MIAVPIIAVVFVVAALRARGRRKRKTAAGTDSRVGAERALFARWPR